jgi:hypothetical protein
MCANFTTSLSPNSRPDAKMVVETDRQNASKLPFESWTIWIDPK